MKLSIKLIMLWLVFQPIVTSAQTIVLQGTVRSVSTHEPIPFANIYLEGTGIGTSSNLEGRFILRISESMKNSRLIVTCIGYESYNVSISLIADTGDMIVGLRESEILLKDITVSVESPAQVVARAFEGIKNNYPVTNTVYTGFYRESNLHSKPDSAEKYYYVIEAVTKLNKPSYESENPEGDIKILQARKNIFVGSNTKFSKWIAGAFTPTRFDVVKKRFDFISPAKQDRYSYTLERYTTYYDKEVFEISFKPVRPAADYEGILYIDMQSYAIVKVDYKFSPAGLRRENEQRSRSNLVHREFKINYQPLGGKWYIQSIRQMAYGYDAQSDDTVRYITEYAATQIDTSAYEAFEYADKIQWNDVFLTKSDPYNENFWGDFNIVSETRELKELLIDTNEKILKEKTPIISDANTNEDDVQTETEARKLRSRLRFNYFLTATILNTEGRAMQVDYVNQPATFSVSESRSLNMPAFAFNTALGAEYDIYNNVYAVCNVFAGFTRTKYNGFEAGIGNRFRLSAEKKRPLFLTVQLSYAQQRLLYKLDEYKIAGVPNAEIEGIRFSKDEITFELSNKQDALKPTAGLQLELNRNLLFFVDVGTFLELDRRENLIFSDKNNQGLLGSIGLKRSELSFSNERLDYRINGQRSLNVPFQNLLFMNVGIKHTFRAK